jgi:hypothetical protein
LEQPTTKSKHASEKSVGLSHQNNYKRRNLPNSLETSTSAGMLDVNALIWRAVGLDSAEVDLDGAVDRQFYRWSPRCNAPEIPKTSSDGNPGKTAGIALHNPSRSK